MTKKDDYLELIPVVMISGFPVIRQSDYLKKPDGALETKQFLVATDDAWYTLKIIHDFKTFPESHAVITARLDELKEADLVSRKYWDDYYSSREDELLRELDILRKQDSKNDK